MKKSGIGSAVTLDANIERLVEVGLISVRQVTGEHRGNEYTVLLPEEIKSNAPTPTSSTSSTSTTSSTQNLVSLVLLETSNTSSTTSLEESTTYDPSKTSFKTIEEKTDDDAVAGLSAVLREAARELTGKNPSPAEAERWRELGEILATELKIAAARTTVSSVPAFLCEHLRRRLWKLDKKQQEKEAPAPTASDTASVQPGKSDETRHCPDCGGTGFYYPDGYEGGVARCRHERAGVE
jgi:hypothetical protein